MEKRVRLSDDVWELCGKLAKLEGLKNERAAVERVVRLYALKNGIVIKEV